MRDGKSALLIIDMLNPYEHEDAGALMQSVRDVLPSMSALIERAQSCEVPVVYVNDNSQDWTAGRREICERALAGAAPQLVQPVLPPADAAFLTKARHSAFYETQLEYLLRSEHVHEVVLAGQVTEQCILYSALDAYVRHYRIVVARDAVAHIHPELAQAALRMMQLNMRARVSEASSLLTRTRAEGAPPEPAASAFGATQKR